MNNAIYRKSIAKLHPVQKKLTSYYERQRLLYGCNPLARRAGLFFSIISQNCDINCDNIAIYFIAKSIAIKACKSI